MVNKRLTVPNVFGSIDLKIKEINHFMERTWARMFVDVEFLHAVVTLFMNTYAHLNLSQDAVRAINGLYQTLFEEQDSCPRLCWRKCHAVCLMNAHRDKTALFNKKSAFFHAIFARRL